MASMSAMLHVQQQLEWIASSLSEDDLQPRVDGKWNALQILEHLYLSYTGTAKGINRVLEAGKPLARPVTMKDRVRTFAVTVVGYFPEGRKSPPVATPKGLDVATVRAGIGSQLSAMNDALTQCAEKFGGATRVLDHPILGPLSANQWRKFHLVHARHHLKQIERRRATRG